MLKPRSQAALAEQADTPAPLALSLSKRHAQPEAPMPCDKLEASRRGVRFPICGAMRRHPAYRALAEPYAVLSTTSAPGPFFRIDSIAFFAPALLE
jgi:hypothetical protein